MSKNRFKQFHKKIMKDANKKRKGKDRAKNQWKGRNT